MQYQEQFFMKPFQIVDQIANTFDINCKLAACSKAENVDGFCVLGDACKDRYATIGLDSVPSGTNDVQFEGKWRGWFDLDCSLVLQIQLINLKDSVLTDDDVMSHL